MVIFEPIFISSLYHENKKALYKGFFVFQLHIYGLKLFCFVFVIMIPMMCMYMSHHQVFDPIITVWGGRVPI